MEDKVELVFYYRNSSLNATWDVSNPPWASPCTVQVFNF